MVTRGEVWWIDLDKRRLDREWLDEPAGQLPGALVQAVDDGLRAVLDL